MNRKAKKMRPSMRRRLLTAGEILKQEKLTFKLLNSHAYVDLGDSKIDPHNYMHDKENFTKEQSEELANTSNASRRGKRTRSVPNLQASTSTKSHRVKEVIDLTLLDSQSQLRKCTRRATMEAKYSKIVKKVTPTKKNHVQSPQQQRRTRRQIQSEPAPKYKSPNKSRKRKRSTSEETQDRASLSKDTDNTSTTSDVVENSISDEDSHTSENPSTEEAIEQDNEKNTSPESPQTVENEVESTEEQNEPEQEKTIEDNFHEVINDGDDVTSQESINLLRTCSKTVETVSSLDEDVALSSSSSEKNEAQDKTQADRKLHDDTLALIRKTYGTLRLPSSDDGESSDSSRSQETKKKRKSTSFKIRFSKDFDYKKIMSHECTDCAKVFRSNTDLQLHCLEHLDSRRMSVRVFQAILPKTYDTATNDIEKYLRPKKRKSLSQNAIEDAKSLIAKYCNDESLLEPFNHSIGDELNQSRTESSEKDEVETNKDNENDDNPEGEDNQEEEADKDDVEENDVQKDHEDNSPSVNNEDVEDNSPSDSPNLNITVLSDVMIQPQDASQPVGIEADQFVGSAEDVVEVNDVELDDRSDITEVIGDSAGISDYDTEIIHFEKSADDTEIVDLVFDKTTSDSTVVVIEDSTEDVEIVNDANVEDDKPEIDNIESSDTTNETVIDKLDIAASSETIEETQQIDNVLNTSGNTEFASCVSEVLISQDTFLDVPSQLSTSVESPGKCSDISENESARRLERLANLDQHLQTLLGKRRDSNKSDDELNTTI